MEPVAALACTSSKNFDQGDHHTVVVAVCQLSFYHLFFSWLLQGLSRLGRSMYLVSLARMSDLEAVLHVCAAAMQAIVVAIGKYLHCISVRATFLRWQITCYKALCYLADGPVEWQEKKQMRSV